MHNAFKLLGSVIYPFVTVIDGTTEPNPGNQSPEAAVQRQEYDNVHTGLIDINFHLPLFLLLIVISLLNFPSFLTWAKHYKYVV